jgi:hypothetical protein
MGKAARIELEGMSAVYGGGGTIRSNGGVGRRGGGKVLSARELKAAKRVVAAERKAAKAAIKARKAGKK